MLTFHLSIDLEKKISFSKGVCSERTLGNEKTSTCPETLVELKFRVGGLLIQTLIELIIVFDRIDFCRSKRPSIETTFDRTDLHTHKKFDRSLIDVPRKHSFCCHINCLGTVNIYTDCSILVVF